MTLFKNALLQGFCEPRMYSYEYLHARQGFAVNSVTVETESVRGCGKCNYGVMCSS